MCLSKYYPSINLFKAVNYYNKIVPEDPVNSTPYVSLSLFISGPPFRDSLWNMVIFLKILESIFTQLRPGNRPQYFVFLKKNGNRFKKSNSGDNVPILNVLKWTPQISKKITMLHIISRAGGPGKK